MCNGISGRDKEIYKQIVDLILEISEIEKIFLLGNSGVKRSTQTIFSQWQEPSEQDDHFYLLLLTAKNDEKFLVSIQEKLESKLQYFVPSTLIVLGVSQFNNWLSCGHPFASRVFENALLLYDACHIIFSEPGRGDEEALNKEYNDFYRHAVRNVREFLAGAELYKIRSQYRLSAFMLHQAAEQALRAMMVINTGLRINTHSIDKLIRYCSMFCPEAGDIFPRNNEKSKKLFHILQKAYIGSRYDIDYSISPEELMKLLERGRFILDLLLKTAPVKNQTCRRAMMDAGYA
jgi:HEPN domain-containing protein